MARVDFEGCILRSMEYREKDRILSLLTPDRGRVDVIARGARKSGRRFGGHLELFSRVHCAADIKENRTLHTLTEAHQVVALPGLREDLVKFAAASYLSEVVLRSAVEAADPELYITFTAWLRLLSTVGVGWEEQVLRAGEIRLLALSGFLPDPRYCGCGSSLDQADVYWVQVPELALACAACRGTLPRLESIEQPVVDVLIRGSSGTLVRDVTVPESPAVLRRCGMLLRAAEEAWIGAHLKSSEFLDSLLSPVSG